MLLNGAIKLVYLIVWLIPTENNLTYSSDEPHKDIQTLLNGYKEEPDSEAQLKLLLPHISSSFGGNRLISETIEELKKYQTSNDSAGILSR